MATELTTERDRDRSRDDNRYRNAQEAMPNDVYYRPEYGWVMSNEGVAAEKEVEALYQANVDSIASQIAANETSFNSSLATGKSEIASAYDKAISDASSSQDLVPVRVVNGNTVEATYMLPRSSVDTMNTESLNVGDGSYTGNWVDDGKYYNIDVRVSGLGGKRGQELHDALRTAVEQNDQAYNAYVDTTKKEKDAAISSFETTSKANFDSAKAVWDAELANAQSAYSERVNTGAAEYADSKAKYNDTFKSVNMGLLETPTNQVNTNAKVK